MAQGWNALVVTQPTLSNHWRTEASWPHSVFTHHWTHDGRSIADFMPALQCQYQFVTHLLCSKKPRNFLAALHRCSLVWTLHVAKPSWHVCLCDGHVDVLWKSGWTDQDAVWGLTLVGSRNHVLDGGSRSHMGRGNFEVVQPAEKHGSLCCGVCSKTDHSIVNNGITPRLL